MYIRQLSIEEKFSIYKLIKERLLLEECYTVDNVINILDGKVSDLCFD